MPDSRPFDQVADALAACLGALDEFGSPYVIIGAVATGLLTEPRATRDVDVSLWLENDERLSELIAVFANHGIRPRTNDNAEFVLQARLVRLVHATSKIALDVALALLPFEKQAIDRGRRVQYGPLKVRVPRPEDLVVMKSVANRPRDQMDIAKLLAHFPTLNLRHVRRWVKEIAELLDSPDLVNSLEDLIRRERRGPAKRPRRKRK